MNFSKNKKKFVSHVFDKPSLFLIFLLISLLLSSVVYSQSPSTTNNLTERWSDLENYSGSNILISFLKDWKTLAVLSLLIAVAMMAFMYMIGEAFDINILKYYFRVEVKEIIANLLLIIFFVSTLSFIDYVSNTFLFDNGQALCSEGFCLDDKIYDYLYNSFYNPIVEQIIDMNLQLAKNMVSLGTTLGSDTIIFAYGSIGYSYDYSTLSYPLLIMKNFYNIAYVGLMITLFSFQLSKSLLGPVVIALGIILRTFFFTKRTGSTLIAVGIGIMVLYPVFNYLFYLPFFQPLSQFGSSQYDTDCPSICSDRVVGLATDLSPLLLSDFRQISEEPGATFSSPEASSQDDVVSDFLEGRIRHITISTELDGYNYISCENLSLDLSGQINYNLADDITKDVITTTYIPMNGYKELYELTDPDGNTVKHGLYCFPECRVLPYPDDNVECRDAETACRYLYENYPNCFVKKYAFEDDDLYTSILNFYGYYDNGPSDNEIEDYEDECPIDCRGIPNLAPGFKGTSLSVFCPSPCREIPVRILKSDDTYSYELVYDPDKISDVCSSEEYDCSDHGSMKGWYSLSDENLISNVYPSDEWSNAINNIHSITSSPLTLKSPYYSIKLIPSDRESELACQGCLSYPVPLRYYPVYVDCSGCAKNPPVPSVSSVVSFGNSAILELGKVLLLVYGIPLVSLIATIYAVAGLSTYLEGDMFIPAINKIFR